ncbi:hypothetical protein SAMN05421678_1342 [Actinopolymorpha cephalotaxi]|nr:hypothetical protein SAMN05421678_1342 [Actinopolymorpha cephalotaxi]
MVETTTLGRGDTDLEWEAYEHRIREVVTALEIRCNVQITLELVTHANQVETAEWLEAIALSARSGNATDARIVQSSVGTAQVLPPGYPSPQRTFTGARIARNGWHRFGRVLQAKVRQSAGPAPVWLRIDALDGLFQFTDWAKLEHAERVGELAAGVRDNLGDIRHLAGIVVSSGLAVALGSTDHTAENRTALTPDGYGIRRLVNAHTVRETIILALHDDAISERDWWAAAYSAEPDWLRRDLAERGFPQLETFYSRENDGQ